MVQMSVLLHVSGAAILGWWTLFVHPFVDWHVACEICIKVEKIGHCDRHMQRRAFLFSVNTMSSYLHNCIIAV